MFYFIIRKLTEDDGDALFDVEVNFVRFIRIVFVLRVLDAWLRSVLCVLWW